MTASVETVKKRLMARNRLEESAALARIRSQISNEERKKHASVVIENDSGDLEDLKLRVHHEVVLRNLHGPQRAKL